MADPLAALPLPGIQPNSLGRYLVALGLLHTAARKWPRVRGAWKDGYFWLVGGPAERGELVEHLWEIGQAGAWTPYERDWKQALDNEKKRKQGEPSFLALQQSEAEEIRAVLSSAHSVTTEIGSAAKQPSSWRFFNPLLGLGGIVGRRDFAQGWRDARDALLLTKERTALDKQTAKAAKRGASKIEKLQNALAEKQAALRRDLEAFLSGGACRYLGSWNAASWFSEANKVPNCGQGWFGGGQVTPWAMLLACEGLLFFAGSPSRRLGSFARSVGAFPFVTRAAAPEREMEAGRDRAEVWLPLWSRPMTVPEIRLLFLRSRAEVGGAGATTPAAFAAAVVRRGVDAGIDGFQRFVLGQTTAADYFESRLEGFVPVSRPAEDALHVARAEVIERILDFCDSLPRDRKKGKRWQFCGLRGAIETALVGFAAGPEDPERALRLMDAVVAALDKVDRNRNYRKAGVRWRLLPLRWLPELFGRSVPSVEARVAMGLASVGSQDKSMLVHRYGVRLDRYRGDFVFPETAPSRRTWGSRPLAVNLSLILRRRLVDARPEDPLPFWPGVRILPADVDRWLSGRLDDGGVERWFSRLVLFDWRDVPSGISELARTEDDCRESGVLAIHALLRPLFEPARIWLTHDTELLPGRTGAKTVLAARQIAFLLAAGDLTGAVRVARSRYHMACQPLARVDVPLGVANPDRLLASLIIPTAPGALVRLTRAWLRPARGKGDARCRTP